MGPAAMPAVMDLPVDTRDTVLTNMRESGRGSWKLPGGTILELSWTLLQSLLPKLSPSKGLKKDFLEYQNQFKKGWCSGPSPQRRETSGCTLVPVAAPPMPWSTRTLLSVRDSGFWSKEQSVGFFKSVSTFTILYLQLRKRIYTPLVCHTDNLMIGKEIKIEQILSELHKHDSYMTSYIQNVAVKH